MDNNSDVFLNQFNQIESFLKKEQDISTDISYTATIKFSKNPVVVRHKQLFLKFAE